MQEVSNTLVCLLGIGIVFFGLICIVFLSSAMSAVCRKFVKEDTKVQAKQPAIPANEIPNRSEFVAAVSAVLAEEMGADVSAIRILSIKKL